MLETLLKTNKHHLLRQIINKFSQNRKIVDIQRNFLKRLLLSKAGMVVLAFRKIQTLPPRNDPELYKKANKFEKGLSMFAEQVVRKSFYAFKT